WRGRQSVTVQDIADRLIGNLIAQIGQCPRNPVIAPVTVLFGHANDQPFDLLLDPRPARGSTGPRTIELAGNELSVYPVHVITRKSLGLMMRKLSVTE